MRLLLDTHALLWWLDGDPRLPVRLRRLIADEMNVVLISAASVWEITTKARLGRLPAAADVATDVPAAIASQGFEPLDITLAHAQRAGTLASAHRDPFDRMLVAQAQLENLPLVTNDEAVRAFEIRSIW